MAGFGLGVFIFNMVTTEIANPNNLPAQAFNYDEGEICQRIFYYYFSLDVAKRVRVKGKLTYYRFLRCGHSYAYVGVCRL